jgi:hypothetical protein
LQGNDARSILSTNDFVFRSSFSLKLGFAKSFRLTFSVLPADSVSVFFPDRPLAVRPRIRLPSLVNLTKIHHLEAREPRRQLTLLPIFPRRKRVKFGRSSPDFVRGAVTWAGSGGWIIRIDKVGARYTIGEAGNIGNL